MMVGRLGIYPWAEPSDTITSEHEISKRRILHVPILPPVNSRAYNSQDHSKEQQD